MSNSSDTSSVIFVAEQKTVQVDVHPPPPTPQNQNSTSSNFVPDTQEEVNNSSTSENALSVIPETGEFTIIFTNSTNCTNSTTNNIIKNYKP